MFDPDLPIRGRYLSLSIAPHVDLTPALQEEMTKQHWLYKRARLEARNGELWAVPDESGSVSINVATNGRGQITISEPVDFFIPEHAQNAGVVQRGEELWVEVTVPKKGGPRPIQLAVKRGDSFNVLPLR
jgi:hypothetical protein